MKRAQWWQCQPPTSYDLHALRIVQELRDMDQVIYYNPIEDTLLRFTAPNVWEQLDLTSNSNWIDA